MEGGRNGTELGVVVEERREGEMVIRMNYGGKYGTELGVEENWK